MDARVIFLRIPDGDLHKKRREFYMKFYVITETRYVNVTMFFF